MIFGIFRSRRQRLFEKYKDVIHGATMAGAAYGFLVNQGNVEAADGLKGSYDLYEETTSDLVAERHRVEVRHLMRELFENASRDEGLMGSMSEARTRAIDEELIRNIEIAQEVLARQHR